MNRPFLTAEDFATAVEAVEAAVNIYHEAMVEQYEAEIADLAEEDIPSFAEWLADRNKPRPLAPVADANDDDIKF